MIYLDLSSKKFDDPLFTFYLRLRVDLPWIVLCGAVCQNLRLTWSLLPIAVCEIILEHLYVLSASSLVDIPFIPHSTIMMDAVTIYYWKKIPLTILPDGHEKERKIIFIYKKYFVRTVWAGSLFPVFVARPGKLVVSPSVRYWQLLELVELYELYCLTGTGLVVLLLSPSLTQNKEELTDCCSLYFKDTF